VIRNATGLLACMLVLGTAACAANGPGRPIPEAAGNEVLVMLPVAPAHFRPDANYGAGYDEQVGRSARRRIASDLASAQDLEMVSEWPMSSLGVDCFLMRIRGERAVEPVLDALARDSRIAWAQALQTYHSLGHSDPLFALQPSAGAWHLDAIHAFTTGRNVSVAELDSGVELTHPDLAGQISISENFVGASAYVAEFHGTAVAGIIAAKADNGIGIVGIAPQARLMALRACWEAAADSTSCNSFTLAKALQFALNNGAQVINMSLTGPGDRLLQLLLGAALSQGVAVVGAVDPMAADGGFPASLPGVIAVAPDDAGGTANFVPAPAREVPTTLPVARWGFVNGSSFAAAQVSGLVALIRELAPSMTPGQTRDLLLLASGTATMEPTADRKYGARINVCVVIARVASACPCECAGSAGAETISRR